MAPSAIDAGGDVGAVIEVRVVRNSVHANPLDGSRRSIRVGLQVFTEPEGVVERS